MGAKDFTEISVKKGMWHFAWREYAVGPEMWEDGSVSSGDKPRKELEDAMLMMSERAAEIMDIREHAGEKIRRILISAVKIKYTDANWYMSMHGSLYTKSKHGDTEIWTSVPIRTYTICDVMTKIDDVVADEKTRDAMNALCECAERYISGERANNEPNEPADKPDPGYEMEEDADE
jgi:hypothetical protein